MLVLTQVKLGEVRALAHMDTRPRDHATPSTRRMPAQLNGRTALGQDRLGWGHRLRQRSDWDRTDWDRTDWDGGTD